jgi:hypothetical protein
MHVDSATGTYMCIGRVFLEIFLRLGLSDLEELLPAEPQAAGEPPGHCYVQSTESARCLTRFTSLIRLQTLCLFTRSRDQAGRSAASKGPKATADAATSGWLALIKVAFSRD